MSNELFVTITQIIISIVGVVLTFYVVPLVKEKVGVTNYQNLLAWTTAAVEAAEQIYVGTGKGEKKKQYVLEFLNSKCVELSVQELDVLIESSVLELKKAVA